MLQVPKAKLSLLFIKDNGHNYKNMHIFTVEKHKFICCSCFMWQPHQQP